MTIETMGCCGESIGIIRALLAFLFGLSHTSGYAYVVVWVGDLEVCFLHSKIGSTLNSPAIFQKRKMVRLPACLSLIPTWLVQFGFLFLLVSRNVAFPLKMPIEN